MRPARVFLALSLSLTMGALGALPALGEDGPPPTTVETVDASSNGDAVAVSATIDWGGTAPVVLGTDPAGDAPPSANATGAHGLDLTAISSWIEDGDQEVATFAWDLETFDNPPPPELVRYYMTFQIDGQAFALQAKTSDFVSGANLANDPETAAERVASYAEHYSSTGTLPQFRVRGNCGLISAGPVGLAQNCGHAAWVSGEFDTENNQIRIHVPLDLASMPTLRPGATLNADQGAYSALQVAVDLPQSRDTMAAAAQDLPYTIPTRTATASIADADGTVVAGPTALTIGDDGAIQGDLDTTGLAAGDYDLTVNACIAANCGTATITVTI